MPPQLGYATPLPATAGPDLRAIALRQKAVMYCILAYAVLVLTRFLVPAGLPVAVVLLLALATLAVTLAAAVYVFMLAMSLYNTAAGVTLGILTLVPLVGLIVLLIINSKATNVLREHGIKVGLMGANSRQIPSPGQGRVAP